MLLIKASVRALLECPEGHVKGGYVAEVSAISSQLSLHVRLVQCPVKLAREVVVREPVERLLQVLVFESVSHLSTPVGRSKT